MVNRHFVLTRNGKILPTFKPAQQIKPTKCLKPAQQLKPAKRFKPAQRLKPSLLIHHPPFHPKTQHKPLCWIIRSSKIIIGKPEAILKAHGI